MKGGTRRIKRTGKGNKTKKFGGAPGKSRAAILSRILKTAKSLKNRAKTRLALQKTARFLTATEKRKNFGKRSLPRRRRMEVIQAIPESTHCMKTRKVTLDMVQEANAAVAAAAAATAKANAVMEEWLENYFTNLEISGSQ